MTAYILLVMVFLNTGPILHTQEFNSEASCKAAGELIWQEFTKAHVDPVEITLSCKPK